MRTTGTHHTRLRGAVAVGLLLLAANVSAAGPTEFGVQRAFIEQAGNRHGEVRFTRNSEHTRVETILYSSILRHVVGQIAKAELELFPEGDRDHEAARLYLQALQNAERRVWQKFRSRNQRTDRRQKMLVVHELTPDTASAEFYAIEIEGSDGEISIIARNELKKVELPVGYVERVTQAIWQEHFGEALDEPQGKANTGD